MDDLIFPDGVLAVIDVIHGQMYAGQVLAAGRQVPADAYGIIQETPFAHVIGQGGTPGYIDQSERLRVDIYAPAGVALNIAQAIKSRLHGATDVVTAEGVLDKIKADQVPTAAPHTDLLDRAVLLLTVISRPKN